MSFFVASPLTSIRGLYKRHKHNTPRFDPPQPSYRVQPTANGITFSIDTTLESPATKVMFNNSHPDLRDICLKTWIACENALYSTTNLSNCTAYLLEGLYFNRRFAPDVYLGIAPVLYQDKQSVIYGPLIECPRLASLQVDRPYVLVMRRLEDSSRLDHKLSYSQLGNKKGMGVLASFIANMHRQLEDSPNGFGTVEVLRKKLQVNTSLFQQSLEKLSLKKSGLEVYAAICLYMEEFIDINASLFLKRFAEKPAKRCHGDLKAVNVWVEDDATLPPETLHKSRRILALDCIDFRPDFCHIDTLSDIAMLAIDLEMRLTYTRGWQIGRKLAAYFLSTYLKEAKEAPDIRPLLEYYMTEKAMVGALMSIHFDNLPTLGEKYLRVALTHANKLKKYLPSLNGSTEPRGELNLQPLSMSKQIDTSVPVFN